MCGDHSQPIHHQPNHHEPSHRQPTHRHSHRHSHESTTSTMVAQRPGLRSRRAFLGDVGLGTLAVAVVTPSLLAACGSGSEPASTTAAETSVSAPTSAPAETEPATNGGGELRWARTNLGFVSAYVLARGNSATIVDTGLAGSAAAIGESLAGLGLNYSNVANVVLTHNHGDHAGSIAEVMAEAVNATVYAGEADLSELTQPDIVGLVGGEDIFGFEMIATPGHTAGHMCAIDHQAGLLVAGDAIFSEGAAVVEGPPQFFADVAGSRDSIKKLASLSFNTVLFGHGEPIETAADAAVAALAASFG